MSQYIDGWTPVTTENSDREWSYTAWLIDCPTECGGQVTAWNSSDDATVKCNRCGAKLQFAVRVASLND